MASRWRSSGVNVAEREFDFSDGIASQDITWCRVEDVARNRLLGKLSDRNGNRGNGSGFGTEDRGTKRGRNPS